MKLSKTKKIILLGTFIGILTASIAIPIVFLNRDETNQENDVEKIFKILQAKTTKEKIIELSSNASGKIIADNQEKIIEKIKNLIGKQNLKEVKIEVLMKNDTNISIAPQKIIIKLTKNKVLKEIEDFSVKRQLTIDEEIQAIKKVLDSKTGNDLIIILPSSSIGNIIENNANKNEIEKKLRILVDPSNTNGDPNHPSLRGVTIEVSMNADAAISTTPQNIIVSISKSGGTTLSTSKTFQVKRDFTADEDIAAIKAILEKQKNILFRISSSSRGSMINNQINKNAIERKVRIAIDPSNKNGDPNHLNLRGTTITLTRMKNLDENDLISVFPKFVVITISKTSGTSLEFNGFLVSREY